MKPKPLSIRIIVHFVEVESGGKRYFPSIWILNHATFEVGAPGGYRTKSVAFKAGREFRRRIYLTKSYCDKG